MTKSAYKRKQAYDGSLTISKVNYDLHGGDHSGRQEDMVLEQ